MDSNKKDQKEENKQPDEVVSAFIEDHILIKDDTGKVILNKRG